LTPVVVEQGEIKLAVLAVTAVLQHGAEALRGTPGVAPLRADRGQVIGAVMLLHDQTERNQLAREREEARASALAERETARQKEEIARRIDLYRGGTGVPLLEGKTVILVDDGVATGATLKAAIATLKQERLARLVVALPVASRSAALELASMVDEWVCLLAPAGFMAVGNYYSDFTQVEDEDVVAMLTK